MKPLAVLLICSFLITGCAAREALPDPAPEVQSAPVQEAETPPEPETAPLPESPDTLESQTPEETALPDLPQPVYCVDHLAISSRGEVLLEMPDHVLKVICDSSTGEARGILAIHQGWITGLYDLEGAPILEDLQVSSLQWSGNLIWYGTLVNQSLFRLSDRTVLRDDLALIFPAGKLLVVQKSYWNSPIELLDQQGQCVRELDKGLRLLRVDPWEGQFYLTVEAKNGTETVYNTHGTMVLPQFYDQVQDLRQGCAVVLDQKNHLAIRLDTGEILFQSELPFQIIGSNCCMVTDLQGRKVLMNRAGETISEPTTLSIFPFDADKDGIYDLVFQELPTDSGYITQVLTPNGEPLTTLDSDLSFVTPVTDELVYYAQPAGSGFQQIGYLYNLKTQNVMKLGQGKFLQITPVETTQGLLFLCTWQNDKDQFLSDLVDHTGRQLLTDLEACTYLGGDVFSTSQGLLCLDGTLLWERPET